MEMLVEEQNTSPLQLYPPPLRRRPPPHQDNILHLKSLHHRSGLYQQTEAAAGQTDKVRLGNRSPASQPMSQLTLAMSADRLQVGSCNHTAGHKH